DRSRIFKLIKTKGSKNKIITENTPLLLSNSQITLNILPPKENESNSLIVLHDVTEQKQAEDELKSARDYAQNIIDSSLDMIISVDNDRKIVEFNRSAEKVFGYRKEEVRGKDVGILYADTEEGVKIRKIMSNTGQFVDQITNKRKNGSIFSTLLSCGLIRNKAGEEIGVVGVSRDITDQKRSERALRESEEKYRNILESIEEGYYEVDLTGNFTFINDSLCKNTGYSKEEFLGMNNRDYTSPETAKYMYKVFNQIYRTGKPANLSEYEITRKDGVKRSYELSASLIIDRDGNAIGFRGLSRDITEQKEAESERRKLEAQLQQARKMEAIGTLAGGIAHDFNNLLMGIQGRTSLMLTDMDFSHPYLEHLNAIEDYIQRATDLNKHLLGLARSGKYEVKPTNINDLIKLNSHMFGRTKKEIKIHRKFQQDIWPVEIDRGQIEQVLLNIFINAWQAMPRGGDLYIQTENNVIDENNRKLYQMGSEKSVKISITDTGTGMDMATQQRIFDPFFTTKELKRGIGLGLASAYGIIKNHGGFIEVLSEIGKGATFSIYLPVSTQKAIKEEHIYEVAKKGKETILLVDDEDIILDVTQGVLEKLGYDVLVAKNGKEAIEIYIKNLDRIDLVVLDMIMPEMDGGYTYDRLKKINPDIKVLLSSGYSINGQANEILAQGCNGFIQKPFNMLKISKKIREIIYKE
ncbi:PAS domain S-box protein, partial [Thermodesulfobacteriota bacterium]